MRKTSERLIARINKLALLELSQEEIAEELCICQTTVSKYINMKCIEEDKLEANDEKGICNQ